MLCYLASSQRPQEEQGEECQMPGFVCRSLVLTRESLTLVNAMCPLNSFASRHRGWTLVTFLCSSCIWPRGLLSNSTLLKSRPLIYDCCHRLGTDGPSLSIQNGHCSGCFHHGVSISTPLVAFLCAVYTKVGEMLSDWFTRRSSRRLSRRRRRQRSISCGGSSGACVITSGGVFALGSATVHGVCLTSRLHDGLQSLPSRHRE